MLRFDALLHTDIWPGKLQTNSAITVSVSGICFESYLIMTSKRAAQLKSSQLQLFASNENCAAYAIK